MVSVCSSRNLLLDLPTEVVFRILHFLEDEDINTLHALQPIRSKISDLFCLVTDVLPSSRYPNITNTLLLSDDVSEKLMNLVRSEDYKATYLWVIVEIHNLTATYKHILTLSVLLENRVTIVDRYFPNNGISGYNYPLWMQTLGPKTQQVTFQNLTKISLNDITLNPSKFRFPKLQKLSFIRCHSFDTNAKFDLPILETLSIEGNLNSINKSLDFTTLSNLKSLTLEKIVDVSTWENIKSESLTLLMILVSGSLVNFNQMEFTKLERMIIKDSDITTFSNIKCPNLLSLHLEQFINSHISIHDLYMPRLTHFLLWVLRIETLYNLHMPLLQKASIMLSNEPVPTVGSSNIIDLTCFESLISIQICCAAEILKYISNLQQLEVRGPFNNPLLFNLLFDNLVQFQIYFNNLMREVPEIKAPKLQSLTISRCVCLRSLKSIQVNYPKLRFLSIEYSGLRQITDLELIHLESVSFRTSTSSPLQVERCKFPSLKAFEATNLALKSDEKSSFNSIDAPYLHSLKLSNFNIDQLEISQYPELVHLSLTGGLENVSISNVSNLLDLDLSRNQFKSLECSRFDSLTSLEIEDSNVWDYELDTPMLKKYNYDGLKLFIPRIA